MTADDVTMAGDPPIPRGRSRWSVRVRITVIATAAFAVAFAAASIALVGTVRNSVEDRQRTETQEALTEAETQLRLGRNPTQVRITEFELTVQVFDSAGQLIGGTGRLVSDPQFLLLRPNEVGVDLMPNESRVQNHELMYDTIETPNGTLTVAVANPLADLEESIDSLSGVLWIATPTLAALLGIAVWFLVGRALRPVEALRREVDEISHTTLDRRVAVSGRDDEITRLAATMNTMLDRLEGASVAQRRFISDASHELRSPVSSIRTEVEVAQRDPQVDWSEVSERVLREDERLAELIDDLLTLARLDETGLRKREPVDLDDLVFEEATRSLHVPLNVDSVQPVRVEGDRARLGRMLRNLVDNAARHATREVRVTLTDDGGTAALDVHDDGPGVAPEDREQIFVRFARLEASRDRDRGGTGLGLAVVRSVAQAHGGTVHVDDSPLGGARFAVRLPTPA